MSADPPFLPRSWFRDAELRELLARGSGPPERRIEAAAGRVVKNYSKVLVASLPDGEGERFVKWYRFPSLRHRLKAALGGSPAARYRRGAAIARSKGFAVPEILAVAHRGTGLLPTDGLVVTAGVEGGTTLAAYLSDIDRRGERRAFLRALGGFVRGLHDAGVEHRDLKEANLLARGAPTDPGFVLLDLEDVGQPAWLGRRKRIRSLVQLYRTLDRGASARDVVAFLQGYFPERAERRRVARATALEVAELAARKDLAEHEDVIRRIDHAGYAWVTTLDGARLTEQIMDFRPDALARHPAVRDVVSTAHGRRYTVELADGDRYWLDAESGCRGPQPPVDRERLDPAARWARSVELDSAGLPTARPVARALARRGTGPPMVAVAALAGERDLDAAFVGAGGPALSGGPRRAAQRALGGLLARLHAAGWSAGRLAGSELGIDDAGAIRLLDPSALGGPTRMGVEERIRDLATLDRRLGEGLARSGGMPVPSRVDRLRVLAAYRHAASDALGSLSLTDLVDAILGRVGRRDAVVETDDRRAPVSCFIICKDEEAFIRDCLESVRWCDDVIVIDSYSTDRTVEICREYTDRVVQRPWPGFVEQKRFGLSLAKNEWVLNLDADERVSPELRREILECVSRDDERVWGYYIPRLVYYLGRWWRHGWYPEYRLRLFRKSRVRWGGVDPHERAFLEDERRSRRLRGDIWHLTYRHLGDQIETISRFTSIAAREAAGRGKRFRWFNLVVNPGVHFFKFCILKRGYRLGSPGFSVAFLVSFHVFLKYAKLWEILERSEGAPDAARERTLG